MIGLRAHVSVVIHMSSLVDAYHEDYVFRNGTLHAPCPAHKGDLDMSEVDKVTAQLNKMMNQSTDSAESLVLAEAIELIGTQAHTIKTQESEIQLGDERIETLQILKDGYYSAMAAWRTSKQTGISITDALARSHRGIPASPAQV